MLFTNLVDQAGESEVLTAVLKWGEHQLVRRIEERGEFAMSTAALILDLELFCLAYVVH